jgi:hypothetical protein
LQRGKAEFVIRNLDDDAMILAMAVENVIQFGRDEYTTYREAVVAGRDPSRDWHSLIPVVGVWRQGSCSQLFGGNPQVSRKTPRLKDEAH